MGPNSSARILGLITARGGSKGIPRKNLAPLVGKPLIVFTFEAALKSTELDYVVLSTDDQEIAELGRQAGVEVPFMRPADLASDTTLMVPVVQHAVTALENQGQRFDGVMLLQPTSPLRKSWHIDEAVKIFRHHEDVDGVIGVCEAKEHPYDMVTFDGSAMLPAVDRPAGASRRQDYPEVHFVSGTLYLVRVSTLMQENTLLPRRSIPYIMDRRYSLDIDSELDLEVAQCLAGKSNGNSTGR